MIFKVIQGHWFLAPIESAYATSYWLPIVTLVISLSYLSYLGHIQASEMLELLYTESCFFFDTPALFQPKFRRAVLGVDPWCWSMRERTLSYQTNRVTVMKNSSLCDHHTSTSRGQTHRRLAVAIPAKNTHGVSYSVTNKSDLSFINYLY